MPSWEYRDWRDRRDKENYFVDYDPDLERLIIKAEGSPLHNRVSHVMQRWLDHLATELQRSQSMADPTFTGRYESVGTEGKRHHLIAN